MNGLLLHTALAPLLQAAACAWLHGGSLHLYGQVERVQELEVRRLLASCYDSLGQVDSALATSGVVPAHHSIKRACTAYEDCSICRHERGQLLRDERSRQTHRCSL